MGRGLAEKFSLKEYVGIDINQAVIDEAIEQSTNFPVRCRFEAGDVLNIKSLEKERFDVVFSLSCADWNTETESIINSCWKYVKKGGSFILTLRLTPNFSMRNSSESFQYVYFGDSNPILEDNIEKAPYVVFNAKEALFLLSNFSPKPASIIAYGYWGRPSVTAVTKYNRLVFTALSVQKGNEDFIDTSAELHLPVDLLL